MARLPVTRLFATRPPEAGSCWHIPLAHSVGAINYYLIGTTTKRIFIVKLEVTPVSPPDGWGYDRLAA
jgi:hypothetical protein